MHESFPLTVSAAILQVWVVSFWPFALASYLWHYLVYLMFTGRQQNYALFLQPSYTSQSDFFLFWITCWVLPRECLSHSNVSLVRFCSQCSLWLTKFIGSLLCSERLCSDFRNNISVKEFHAAVILHGDPHFCCFKIVLFFLRHGSMNTAGVLLYALTCCKWEFREDFIMI